MAIAAVLSTHLRTKRASLAIALAVVAGLSAGGCSDGSLVGSYRQSSDWLNNVPPPPAAGPWKLSKQPQNQDMPFPNLGDVPARPVGLASPEEVEEQVRLLQSEAGQAAKTNGSKPAQKTALSGAPAPAKMAPLQIPGRSSVR